MSQNLDPNLPNKAEVPHDPPGRAAAERERMVSEARSMAAKLHKQANELHTQANYILAAKLYKEVRKTNRRSSPEYVFCLQGWNCRGLVFSINCLFMCTNHTNAGDLVRYCIRSLMLCLFGQLDSIGLGV